MSNGWLYVLGGSYITFIVFLYMFGSDANNFNSNWFIVVTSATVAVYMYFFANDEKPDFRFPHVPHQFATIPFQRDNIPDSMSVDEFEERYQTTPATRGAGYLIHVDYQLAVYTLIIGSRNVPGDHEKLGRIFANRIQATRELLALGSNFPEATRAHLKEIGPQLSFEQAQEIINTNTTKFDLLLAQAKEFADIDVVILTDVYPAHAMLENLRKWREICNELCHIVTMTDQASMVLDEYFKKIKKIE